MEHRIRDTKKAKVYLINFNFENWNVSNDTSNLSLKNIIESRIIVETDKEYIRYNEIMWKK